MLQQSHSLTFPLGKELGSTVHVLTKDESAMLLGKMFSLEKLRHERSCVCFIPALLL